MSRGWRRWWAALRAASRTSFRLPKALRSWLRFEALEDRLVPAFASPPDHLLPAADALAVAAPRLDADGLADLAVLGRTGRLTTALNTGLDSWLPSTIDLGEPNPAGFAFGTLDRDPFADAVIQTPDGLLVGTGDGRGRFGGWRHVNPGPAGAFTAGAGIRVEPAVGYLAGDTFADVVTVAPGTNEVVVL